ncbi:MAG TPA: SDR family oxidoreductase [Spirochaetota bacterium]|nr:SDR family oxidoreductase [Spirochaetota bacterium]HOD15759.1 SDR family oxidoreductase [Spirochaetota bacterium]HPG51610.1 SDR family oxidoreductase [Spirochaetota bacterium]HPN12695.1 SDR family oxidoreductase [Spirochaetota bacterium]HQL80578.1 SDR family oxidoreductase [Spirochaetota bacterium]
MNILVTGGAEGLGKAITVRLLREEGNRVWITYPASPDRAREIGSSSGSVKSVKCDYKSPEDIEALAAAMPGMDLDVLVNNATVGYTQEHFHKMRPGLFIESFSHNVYPVMRITQQAIALFRKKKFGKIINVLTSYLINRPPTGLSEYVANKAYLESMSKSWAVENARFNITSNSISPSFMRTGFTSAVDERIVEEMAASHPLKKLLTPEEVADIVFFFVDAPQHVNGVNLPVNCASDIV